MTIKGFTIWIDILTPCNYHLSFESLHSVLIIIYLFRIFRAVEIMYLFLSIIIGRYVFHIVRYVLLHIEYFFSYLDY